MSHISQTMCPNYRRVREIKGHRSTWHPYSIRHRLPDTWHKCSKCTTPNICRRCRQCRKGCHNMANTIVGSPHSLILLPKLFLISAVEEASYGLVMAMNLAVWFPSVMRLADCRNTAYPELPHRPCPLSTTPFLATYAEAGACALFFYRRIGLRL